MNDSRSPGHMGESGGARVTGNTDLDSVEALIAALEEACPRGPHQSALPYLGMARSELARCRPGRSARLAPVPVTSVPQGLVALESLLTGILQANTDLTTTMRLLSARQLLQEAATAIS